MAKRAPKLPILARDRAAKASKPKNRQAANAPNERPMRGDAGSVRSAGAPGMFPKGGRK